MNGVLVRNMKNELCGFVTETLFLEKKILC